MLGLECDGCVAMHQAVNLHALVQHGSRNDFAKT